jgi:hypothetical protein
VQAATPSTSPPNSSGGPYIVVVGLGREAEPLMERCDVGIVGEVSFQRRTDDNE